MKESLFPKARAYAALNQLRLGAPLGSGHHGSVFVAERNAKPNRSAIKIHKEREPYFREKTAYERLAQKRISRIEGFAIPQLLSADDELLVLEMTIVEPPFLLDFASAYLDSTPDFPDNVWDEWREQKCEEFGQRWPLVEDTLMILRMHGVHLLNVHARNIVFLD